MIAEAEEIAALIIARPMLAVGLASMPAFNREQIVNNALVLVRRFAAAQLTAVASDDAWREQARIKE